LTQEDGYIAWHELQWRHNSEVSSSYVYIEAKPRVKGGHNTKASIFILTLACTFSPNYVTTTFVKDQDFNNSNYLQSLKKGAKGYYRVWHAIYKQWISPFPHKNHYG